MARTESLDGADEPSVDELVARIRQTLERNGVESHSAEEVIQEIRDTIASAGRGTNPARADALGGQTMQVFSRLPSPTRHKIAELWQRILEEELEPPRKS